jgi:hypothetical protein
MKISFVPRHCASLKAYGHKLIAKYYVLIDERHSRYSVEQWSDGYYVDHPDLNEWCQYLSLTACSVFIFEHINEKKLKSLNELDHWIAVADRDSK